MTCTRRSTVNRDQFVGECPKEEEDVTEGLSFSLFLVGIDEDLLRTALHMAWIQHAVIVYLVVTSLHRPWTIDNFFLWLHCG